MSEDEVRALGEKEALVLFLLVLFPGNRNVAFLRCMLTSILNSGTVNAAKADAVCASLVKLRFVKRIGSRALVDAREYKMSVRFTAGALAALRDRAVSHRWFPNAVEIRSAYAEAEQHMTSEFGGHYTCSDTAFQRVQTVRAMLGACRTPDVGKPVMVTSDGAFDAACFLTGILSDDARILTGVLKGPTDVCLLPAGMSAFFCAGRDVGGILDAIKAAVGKDDALRFPAGVVLTYGALRTWRGEISELDGIEGWMVSEDGLRMRGVENAFRCALAGEWAAANTTFSGLVSSRILSGGNPILLPFFALVFAIALRVGAPEAKIHKLYRLMRKSQPMEVSGGWSYEMLRNKVIGWTGERIMPFRSVVDMARITDSELRSFLASTPSSFAAVPFAFATRHPRMIPLVREATSPDVGMVNLLRQADKVTCAGYPLLGAILLAGYSRFGNVRDSDYARVVDVVNKSGVPWLLTPYEKGADWKALVEGLAKIVGTDASAADKDVREKKGKVVWGFQFSEIIYDDAYDVTAKGPTVITCTEVTPYYRGPRSPDDGSGDRRMSVAGISGKAYRNLLTEQDRRVLDEIQKSRYNALRDRIVPASILEALVDHPNAIEVFPGGYFYGDSAHEPRVMTFTRLAWHVLSVQTGEGALSLSLPSFLKKATEKPCIVRFGLRDFRYLKLSERERQFVSGWFALAPDGIVDLPARAIRDASPVLSAMARIAPIEGNLSSIADTSDLERIPGETVPTVRLAYKDDVLSASLCLKPYAKNAALVVKPGAGAPERMIKDGAATRVLVRNLAGEKDAAKRVTDALTEFDGWEDGEGTWAVGELPDALGMLVALKDLGEAVRLEWLEGARLDVVTKIVNKGGLKSRGGADRWFRVDGAFEIDEGVTLSLMELLKAFRRRTGRFVSLDDKRFLRISAALARRLEALEAAARERGGGLAVAPAALPMLDRAFSDMDGGDALPKEMVVEARRVREAFAAQHGVPQRLKATLRPYQEEGFVWLSRLADCGFGACLADDMGLGKTVQLIALLLARARDGASLVVAPTSVGGNWRHEIERFAPTLACLCAWEGEDADWLKAGPHDIVIVSYGMLVAREEKFLSREWNGVVLDEAQAIKNEGTERARTVKKLAAKFRVAATGTPIENRLTELWSIFDFLNPGMLGTSNEFIARMTEDGHATPALKNLVKPLVLRRLKREVLDDLPDKTEVTLTVSLDENERAGYEACRRKALETLAAGGQNNRISILAELTRLRRYCCHPSLVMPEMADSAKMEALVELLRDLKGANHRVLVFSQFTDYLALVEQRIAAEGFTYQYLDGATSPKERERRVAAFQKGEGDVFLMSLKAGGTGLNLTAANYVILLDPWWNPAVEDQAADRVHRIGQKQPVTVYRLIAADTVEERVLELHAEKKQLASDVLDGTGSTALSPEALMKLFG